MVKKLDAIKIYEIVESGNTATSQVSSPKCDISDILAKKKVTINFLIMTPEKTFYKVFKHMCI